MRALLATLALIVSAGGAWAGCANFTDGSLKEPAPKLTLCFDGACEETTLDYICSNVHGTSKVYGNGWSTSIDEATKKVVVIRPVVVPAKDYPKISCKAANPDDEADACAMPF